MKLKGTITALITPFIHQKLDEEGLAQNIRYQIKNGINGILPLGTTGEAPTLSSEEQQRVISIAVREAKSQVPVWVGTGSYCTQQTIEKTQAAKDLGADVALIVTPYYNKPTQEGIYRHFEAIATRTEMPIVIYNIPGRCGTNIETATLMRIAELPHIVGVKEASGNINQAGDVLHTIAKKNPHFSLFSGDDTLALPMMALGASGVISVVSNLVPDRVIALTSAALQGQFERAQEIHYQLLPLFKAAFIETNPVPIKTAMRLCGMPAGDCRQPLWQMAPENLNTLHQLLADMQLIK
jgi:4-hydroxy-tetrahydrodipicolinate synthase